MDGLSIEGAEYSQEEKRIVLTESLSSKLPKCNLKWIHKDQEASERIEGMEYIQIPVYLNKQRTNLLTSVSIPTYGIKQYIWYQRGVAIFAWNSE